jgi:nucleoside-diphosphate-sugar epimerase
MALPARIENVDHLEDLLSEPTPAVVETLRRLEGDVILLGAGGKMGPTVARMVRRGSDLAGVRRRVLAVARFSDAALPARLQQHGVETIACDLLDPVQLERLPEAPNVVLMTGMKFGSTGKEARTWAMNVWLPGSVCRKFQHSRIVAFSTGNVYPLTPVTRGGSLESDPLLPAGDYAMSCVGRERIVSWFSETLKIPLVLLRLNYANEMRYGVLVDIARKVHAGEAVDLTMGNLNAIWQGDASAMALAAFDHVAVPPCVLNLAGPETLSVRGLAEQFGELLKRPVRFTGNESPDAFLSNSQRAHQLFGYPQVSVRQMVEWIADWVARGGESLGKPTNFEVRDGKF